MLDKSNKTAPTCEPSSDSAQFGPNGIALARDRNSAFNLEAHSNSRKPSDDTLRKNKSAQFGPNGLALACERNNAFGVEEHCNNREDTSAQVEHMFPDVDKMNCASHDAVELINQFLVLRCCCGIANKTKIAIIV